MAKDSKPHLRVRIEPRLLARLEKSREKNGRTLTGEIVERLEQSFRRDDSDEQMKRYSTEMAKEVQAEMRTAFQAALNKRSLDKLNVIAGADLKADIVRKKERPERDAPDTAALEAKIRQRVAVLKADANFISNPRNAAQLDQIDAMLEAGDVDGAILAAFSLNPVQVPTESSAKGE